MNPLLFDNHPADSRITGPVVNSQTLSSRMGTGGGQYTFGHSGFGKYTESNTAETLRASGGDLGGGLREPYHLWNKVGALCATDYKWVQQEQVDQGKIIPIRQENCV